MEIRQNPVVQGDQETRKGASEGYACILGKKNRLTGEVTDLPVAEQRG